MRQISTWCVALLLLGCGDDGDTGGDSSSSSEGTSSSSETTTSTTTTAATTMPAETSSSESGPPTDCSMSTDCASCWQCARTGPCIEEFNGCAMSPDCAGSLFCIDSMCTGDGITAECAQLCCMNCMEHMICGVVDTWLVCMQEQCGDHCMPNDCSP